MPEDALLQRFVDADEIEKTQRALLNTECDKLSAMAINAVSDESREQIFKIMDDVRVQGHRQTIHLMAGHLLPPRLKGIFDELYQQTHSDDAEQTHDEIIKSILTANNVSLEETLLLTAAIFKCLESTTHELIEDMMKIVEEKKSAELDAAIAKLFGAMFDEFPETDSQQYFIWRLLDVITDAKTIKSRLQQYLQKAVMSRNDTGTLPWQFELMFDKLVDSIWEKQPDALSIEDIRAMIEGIEMEIEIYIQNRTGKREVDDTFAKKLSLLLRMKENKEQQAN